MANKVYWKALHLLLLPVKKYIQRWDNQLKANLTTPQYQCVVATLEAVIICLNALPVNTPDD